MPAQISKQSLAAVAHPPLFRTNTAYWALQNHWKPLIEFCAAAGRFIACTAFIAFMARPAGWAPPLFAMVVCNPCNGPDNHCDRNRQWLKLTQLITHLAIFILQLMTNEKSREDVRLSTTTANSIIRPSLPHHQHHLPGPLVRLPHHQASSHPKGHLHHPDSKAAAAGRQGF